MKKIILVLVVLAFLTGRGFCHPPTDIVITVSGIAVDVIVMHAVSAPKTHYIDDIAVSVNGKEMITQKFIMQTEAALQRAVYVIPSLKKGDKIEVEADCNKSGKLKKSITI